MHFRTIFFTSGFLLVFGPGNSFANVIVAQLACAAVPDGTLIPHPTDPASYFLCTATIATLQSCTGTHHFFPSRNACGPPSSGKELAVQTRELPDVRYPDFEPTCASDNTYYIAHPYNCTQYFICYIGVPIPRYCSNGLYFNPATRLCDEPYNLHPNTSCLQNPDPETTPAPPGSPECRYAPDGTYLEDPNDCEAFYFCFNGEAYHERCYGGLYFNPETKNCTLLSELPSWVRCLGDVSPSPSTTEAPIVSQLCAVAPNRTYVPHPTDCSSFYICYLESAYPFTCPQDLGFNQDTFLCDYPENLPSDSICLHDPEKICAIPWTSDGTYLSDPTDCASFYICYDHQPHKYKCPGDLLYNPWSSLCTIPLLLPPGAPCSPNPAYTTVAPTTGWTTHAPTTPPSWWSTTNRWTPTSSSTRPSSTTGGHTTPTTWSPISTTWAPQPTTDEPTNTPTENWPTDTYTPSSGTEESTWSTFNPISSNAAAKNSTGLLQLLMAIL